MKVPGLVFEDFKFEYSFVQLPRDMFDITM
jgi:hypothetical protein